MSLASNAELRRELFRLERQGNFQAAARVADQLVQLVLDPRVQDFFKKQASRLWNKVGSDIPSRFNQKLGPSSAPMSGAKRDQNGHLKTSPTTSLMEIISTRPGICKCPPRTFGVPRKFNNLSRVVRDNTLSYVTRFQNLSTPSDVSSTVNSVGLQYPLSYVESAAARETALPFYIFEVGLLPEAQTTIADGIPPVNTAINAAPKVCYRLHFRLDHNYSQTGTAPIPQYFFRAFDSNIAQNAPDAFTFGAKNAFKIEWSSAPPVTNVKSKYSYLSWVEVQTLLRQGGAPGTDNNNIHTGFIQFPKELAPPQSSYTMPNWASDNTTANAPMTYEETVESDAFWTRFFNKRTAHPLMRSGGANSKLAPRMFFEQTHCLKNELAGAYSTTPAMVSTCDRWNIGRTFDTTDDSDALAMGPNAEVANSYRSANYAQIFGNEGFGIHPDFGKNLYAFVYATRIGPPATVLPAEGVNPSFDIMIRQHVTTSTNSFTVSSEAAALRILDETVPTSVDVAA